MESKTAGEMQEHIRGTYFGVRTGLGVIGILLPFVLFLVGGFFHEEWLEPSISAYYYTDNDRSFFTTRDFFVGGLFAAAACLYLYKGFSKKENRALNLAGVFAVFVALLPTAATKADRGVISFLHITSAVLFFVCIAYVSVFRSRDTLELLPEQMRGRYKRRYTVTSWALGVSPVAALIIAGLLKPIFLKELLIFFLEACAVWAFGAYWFIKTLEMRETNAERRAMDGELERVVLPAATVEPHASRAVKTSRAVLGKLSPKFEQVERVVPVSSEQLPR